MLFNARVTRSFLALAALLAGCGDGLQRILCDGGACGTQTSWQNTYQTALNRRVDILFVVDDTSAIAAHGGGPGDRVCEARGGGESHPLQPTSIHAGFIRAGRCNASTRASACNVTAPDQFMRHEWCGTVNNLGGPFTRTFGCLANLGADGLRAGAAAGGRGAGCSTGPPLAGLGRLPAARRVLAGRRRGRLGRRLRIARLADARLDIAAGLKGLKPDPCQVLVVRGRARRLRGEAFGRTVAWPSS